MTDPKTSTKSSPSSSDSSIDGSGGITPLQYTFAAIMLGASAGLTLYTKRTSTIINQIDRASKNAIERRGPQKFGPRTKMEWEKLRNRWEKDDL